jgi:hypothetical protein
VRCVAEISAAIDQSVRFFWLAVSMTPLTTTLQLDASADWLWALVTNFAHYADWNPLVPHIAGEPRLNARVQVRVAPEGRRQFALRARVLVAARNRELRWHGRARFPGLLRIEHGCRIEQRAGSCRVHQSLSAEGWLVGERLGAALARNFEAMNAALQERAAQAARDALLAQPTGAPTPPRVRADPPRVVALRAG